MRFRQLTDEEINKRIQVICQKIKKHIADDLQQGEDFGEVLADKIIEEHEDKFREKMKTHWVRVDDDIRA